MAENHHRRRLGRLTDTFVGVVLGEILAAGFSYLAEQRQAHREAVRLAASQGDELRQATRLVDDDLVSSYVTIGMLADGSLLLSDFQGPKSPWPFKKYFPLGAWKEQRTILARYLTRESWDLLSGTFTDIGRLPELLLGVEEATQEDLE